MIRMIFKWGVFILRVLYKGFGIITNIITWVVIICILAAVCVLGVPKFFGVTPFIVQSGSMEPVIHTGSIVYITKMDEEPQEGDIVAYLAGDGLAVVHRIIGRGDTGYITKGDANSTPDMIETAPSQIIGRYAMSVPYAGYLLAGVQSHVFYVGPLKMPAVIPAAIGVLLLLNFIEYVMGLFIPDDNEESN